MINYISSLKNKFFREIFNLKLKKYRYLSRSYLIEGIRFVRESLENSCDVKFIILSENKKDFLIEEFNLNNRTDLKVFVFSDLLFSKVKQTENSQGIIACLNMKDVCNEFDFSKGIYFMLDRIQDPGNLGTIIRTAVAVNALGIIIVKGTIDLYNDKVLRSTMGAIFKSRIYFVDDYSFVDDFFKNGFKFIVADSSGEKVYYDESLTDKIVLVAGNEGRGISRDFDLIPHTSVRIPMFNNLESLNVAQALSIISFEYIRQSNCK